MSKVINDKKQAGAFARQVIEANIDRFMKFGTPKEAWSYFHDNYPKVNLTYDNFWYHLKKAKESNGGGTVKASVDINNIEDIVSLTMAPETSVEDIEIKLYDPKTEKMDEEIFTPYVTGKFKDNVISKSVGFMPGTTIVYTGGPSVGKTTVSLDDLYNAKTEFINSLNKASDRKTAEDEFVYFSSEMKRIDLQAEQKEKEWMTGFKSILMSEYPKHQYKALVEKVICHGYRMLVIDSFQNIVERLVTFCHMTASTAATFVLNCIERANEGQTTTGHHTTILLIQQVTKAGVFVGKNNLKHDTTAMLEFKFDENKHLRYCEFTKNRRNGSALYKRLYYTLNEKNEVVYNETRWNEDRDRDEMVKKEKQNLEEANEQFNSIFLNKGQTVDVDIDDDEDF